ncbi:hypothetical protein ABIB38_001236 [Massilia sp. UYP11]|uniref:DUF3306 domain-containing protein n=1 Tax=Massilia sp. UYP11 TaxID=1756385 RepID=UPI003D1EE293
MSADVMAEEGFLRRWARLKAAPAPAPEPAPASVAEPAGSAAPPLAALEDERALPTLDDVARLTPQSDYSVFVAKGVDKTVQRMALKKLFADPGFAVMDGLDIYIADYTQSAPLTDAMLASLRHAPGVLNRLLGEHEDEHEHANEDKHEHEDEHKDELGPAAEGAPGTPTQGTP